MPNEGVLFKKQFGGDAAHTEDHPAIFRSGFLAAGHGAIAVGTVIADTGSGLDAYRIIPLAGDVPAHPNGEIVGIAEFGADAADTSVLYLAHGTVKKALLKMADGSAFTDYAALHILGIYEV
jgi:hypothetical protein